MTTVTNTVVEGRIDDQAETGRAQGITEDLLAKILYLTVVSLDPTGRGRVRWTNRWKPALNALDMAFQGRISAGRH